MAKDKPTGKTKLAQVMDARGVTQTDLWCMMYEKHGYIMGRDRINKFYHGKLKNMTVATAKIISDTLGVKIDDIID